MPPFGYYIGFDQWYFILIIPAVIISLIAQIKVKSTFAKYSKIPTMRGLTGAQAAEAVLRKNGVAGVRIERVGGELTDHYDPKTNVIRLSDSVYSSNSIAAVGVAAHEAGHAVQYAEEYVPIKIRSVIFPIAQTGSYLSWILILLVNRLFYCVQQLNCRQFFVGHLHLGPLPSTLLDRSTL